MTFEVLCWLSVFAPLLGFLIVFLLLNVIGRRLSCIVTSGLMFISFVASVILFKEVALNYNVIWVKLFPWIASGSFIANFAIYVDSLTAVMLIVVTSVSLFVHIYSIGYMSHDKHIKRFMAYLSLFTFFMLCLVTSDNFIQMFMGWEGVGLSSYLLIGFWYTKSSANNAAIKAFLVNRVADIGFALGICMVFMFTGSVEFHYVFEFFDALDFQYDIFSGENEIFLINVMAILLFIGCMGKSAQIGLHTWLPDAMEGPTPVSALIHAATMVTAGVFMLARCSVIYEYAAHARDFITIVGAVTCFFAATVALVQNDIKKIIAYSTCSQLGYMFFACGVAAYNAAMFHLMTHAFFKALLFLGAGSVIHAVSNEQDIRKMGGIWRKIPYTYAMIWIGSLALAGIYPFAGFYSKDLILEVAYASDGRFGKLAYWIGLFSAGLTAFYSWRLIFYVFHGNTRLSKKAFNHVHESPLSMTIPLGILAVGAVCSGFLGVMADMTNSDLLFWYGSIPSEINSKVIEKAHHLPYWVGLAPTVASLIGILLAYVLYVATSGLPERISNKFSFVYNFLEQKWHFDNVYNFVFVNRTKHIARCCAQFVDRVLIDGVPNLSAALSMRLGRLTALVQTGYLYHYIMCLFIGVIIMFSLLIYSIS